MSKEGLKSALSITEDQLGELLSIQHAEQLPLIPLPAIDPQSGKVTTAKRGPGRPAGSTNKRTQEWADYLIGRYGSPLEALAQIYARPLHVLIAELGCKPLEAIKVQIAAAAELAPYVHQKLPVQVDLGDQGLVNLVINIANERSSGRQTSDGTLTIDMVPVIDENPAKSEA